ncbi:uncharacterized protein BYT42DRAFT_616456 [Radiomyces spectabilis]|uniref:uncharacterized protein n=1 Tax=Radiomyces spectabilis TaxID=64574 RepID=UPI00221ECCFA|nr:uncharacterized protein BYT42DRAFT_616456 [Radiomyces spectabilis]KAI8371355.1 hypothetical protein BYT42DRAFT_616456 [Radiomyces spectabilis]
MAMLSVIRAEDEATFPNDMFFHHHPSKAYAMAVAMEEEGDPFARHLFEASNDYAGADTEQQGNWEGIHEGFAASTDQSGGDKSKNPGHKPGQNPTKQPTHKPSKQLNKPPSQQADKKRPSNKPKPKPTQKKPQASQKAKPSAKPVQSKQASRSKPPSKPTSVAKGKPKSSAAAAQPSSQPGGGAPFMSKSIAQPSGNPAQPTDEGSPQGAQGGPPSSDRESKHPTRPDLHGVSYNANGGIVLPQGKKFPPAAAYAAGDPADSPYKDEQRQSSPVGTKSEGDESDKDSHTGRPYVFSDGKGWQRRSTGYELYAAEDGYAGYSGIRLAAQPDEADSAYTQGEATFYDAEGHVGICGKHCKNTDLVASVNTEQMGEPHSKKNPNCGKKIEVTGSEGNKITVTVVDICKSCKPGGLDLSPAAFGKLGDYSHVAVPIKWKYES